MQRGVRMCVLAVFAVGAVIGVAGCGEEVQGTSTAASSESGATTTRGTTTAETTAETTASAAPAPTGDLTAMTCGEFLVLDDATQESTLEALADQLDYETLVNPSNYLIVQSLCQTDESKLVKDWLGRV